MRFGIIGGTGFYAIGEAVETRSVETAYGTVLVDLTPFGGEEVAFIARHGREHAVPPHQINHRANIAALRALGVERILASAAVGSLNSSIQPGELALPSQFIDFTHGRTSTFFEGARGQSPFGDSPSVRHVDMTEPYCPDLREAMQRAGRFLEQALHPSVVYVCTQGPRFETPAEIEMFRRLGGDVVGMTGVPEAPLAREAGLCYAALAVVANYAAGMSQEPLRHGQISSHMAGQVAVVKRVFADMIAAWKEPPAPSPGAGRCGNCAATGDAE
ncbi:MAG TPA: S-methyl-5'-thioinosine phosphorylase [Armatimonadota bacterium]|nr:S-methyl-5'-thioinosine phosphorylase [Armatimonadota bacterium]